jgi:hypothetical protein
MTNLVVTGLQLETGMATIDTPHSELLARAAAALARWQHKAEQAEKEMAQLKAAGVFLDDDGEPVVPTWWERQDRDYRYLVWPTAYARRTGTPRRQYIRWEEWCQ